MNSLGHVSARVCARVDVVVGLSRFYSKITIMYEEYNNNWVSYTSLE